MADSPQTGAPVVEPVAPVAPVTQPPAPATKDTSIEETVTMSKKDRDEIISQRDRANEDLRKAREAGGDGEAFLAQLAQERHIEGFLKDNAKDYPDVTTEDLMHVSGPDEVEAEAKRVQRRYEDVSQKRLQEVQRLDMTPQLSAEDKAAQIEEIRKNPGTDGFERMVKVRSQ